MSKRKTEMVSPQRATGKQLLLLKRDNISAGDFDILVSPGDVYLKEQKLGEYPTQQITIPKKNFDRLIKFYMTEQKIKEGNKP